MRRVVPVLAALALLGPPAGVALAAPASFHVVKGPIGCTVLSQGEYGFPVRVLQGDLKQLGVFPGRVSGVFGTGTAAALGRFQAGHGLSATGILDVATLTAIKTAMNITGPNPSCGTSTSGGTASGSGSTGGTSGTGNSGGASTQGGGTTSAGSSQGGGSTSGGSSQSGGSTSGSSSQSGGSTSGGSGATAGSASMVGPLAGVISPTPRVAIDYEYTWFTPGFPLTASCASQTSYGAWDASHGYAGIVLDLGNPLGLQSRNGLAGAESLLRNAETCFAKGYANVAPGVAPVIYVGFSNSGSSSTAGYQRAGTVAGDYVATGTADVKGAWLDIESDWSTVAEVHAEVLGYLSVNPANSGHGQWCDSTYRNYASGLPNSTWTVASMMSQYVSPLINAGYGCLGSQRILIPQAYAASWLTNGSANFSPSSALAPYVGGITVCGAVESAGRCPDLGIGSSGVNKWSAYARAGYAAPASSVVAVVGGGALKIKI